MPDFDRKIELWRKMAAVAVADKRAQRAASAAIFYITGKNLTLAMLTDGVTPRRYYDPTTRRRAGGHSSIWR